jgi:GPH family glycoside/pentoside/hexuronide:cation symporter
MSSQPDIPRANRIVYASGSIAGNVVSRSLALWLVYFFAPPKDETDLPTLVPRIALGAIIFAITFIDAVDDPLIGFWSDRTRSRWGRRIPFVVLSTPFYALTFVLLWFPPGEDAGHAANAAFIFTFLWLHHLFPTLSGGPFESLLPELARGSRERVSIVTWQVFFGAIGAAVGLVVSGLIKDAFSFQAMAVTMALVAMTSRYVALWGAWRYARRDVPPVPAGAVRAFRDTLRNRQFLHFLPTFILFNMAVTLLTATLPFYADSVVLADGPLDVDLLGVSVDLEEGGVTAVLTGVAIAVVVLGLPLVYRLSVRRGKAWVYANAMRLGAIGFPFVFFMGFLPGLPVMPQSLAFVAFIGLPMAAVFTFPNAITADIIDYDEQLTGTRREAIYYGAQATLEKAAGALYAPLLAFILLLGETADDPLGIRLAGPVAGVAALLGYLFFRGYRLPDHVTADSLRESGFNTAGEIQPK